MADLMRLSRSWLLSSSSSIRPIIRPTHPASLLLLLSPSWKLCTTSPCCAQSPKSFSRSRKPRKPAAVKRQAEKAMQVNANLSFLLPLTTVFPPISRYPRHPRKFAHMVWLRLKNKTQAWWTKIGMQLLSQPRMIISRPRLAKPFGNAIPSAKALHVQMSEALASGDKDTLRGICMPGLYGDLAGVVDARPAGERAVWELVCYDRTWRYPALSDARIAPQPTSEERQAKMIKQAVVSISSVQRLARYSDNNGGAMMPGSERERQMVEHIVLQAEIDQKTYESQPWKIWGNLSESTYDSYLEDQQNMDSMMERQVQKS